MKRQETVNQKGKTFIEKWENSEIVAFDEN